MPPNEKKQCLRPPDVLSNLDNNLIDNILTRLPLRDAVRTSILAKYWRYVWRRLPHLKLDQTVWKTTEELMSPTVGFTPILYHLYALPIGPVSKLTLDILRLDVCPDVYNLIYFIFRNCIQHVVLKLPFSCKPYILPCLFFMCSLRHLFLMECLIDPPWFFKGFDGLVSLKLKSVMISSESLESLISHCPLLENLVLKDLYNTNLMKISAPKLRSFVFRGNIQFLYLENVPLLSNVSCTPKELPVEAADDLSDIFESIPALENLIWDQSMVADVGPAEVIPARLPSDLKCLKRLDISWFTLGEFFELSLALCLIRSSPNLEEIEIKVCFINDEDYVEPVPRDALDEIPASFSDMTFNHLRTVKFYDVIGAEVEMQLIKVLLAKSSALVKMVIEPHIMDARKSLEVLAEIAKFQRASSKAEVVYKVDYHNPA
ncbi:F-box/FBD/LRR-repeat protein At1g13570-like [Solanum dulcamara]|uniref:F-box/FBD/LRR-repeat protein At1g13570-like n=1 Tax=Solanum dulcamara TaxID=45834 RepID=UPI002485F03A|nr:F-box/FBD/LRR-repeat protein At1g13570-like [Solanum dulcamara]